MKGGQSTPEEDGVVLLPESQIIKQNSLKSSNDYDDNTPNKDTFSHRIRSGMHDCWSDKGFYMVICVVSFVQGSSSLSKLASDYFFKDDAGLSPAQLA